MGACSAKKTAQASKGPEPAELDAAVELGADKAPSGSDFKRVVQRVKQRVGVAHRAMFFLTRN